MFQSARLKLTAWYLTIIMLVSISFSAVIFRVLTGEVDRFSNRQRVLIERRLRDQGLVPPDVDIHILPAPYGADMELIADINHRILLRLVVVNGVILVLAGGLGYMLAGRTLKPIADMVDEQNRFISDASHEIRTPLTALKTSMEVNLRDKKLSVKDAKTLLREGVGQVNKLQSLSDSLLQLTQVESPDNQSRMTKEKLPELIHRAAGQIAPMAKSKSISIAESVPDITVRCDREKLTDLFVILLDNAVKYSPEHTTARISAKRTDGLVTVRVKDEGIGITPSDLPHIFDRFYRADSARSHAQSGGYGLGLSIAKKIIDMHHGSITVTSKPKAGTEFTVKLPVYYSA